MLIIKLLSQGARCVKYGESSCLFAAGLWMCNINSNSQETDKKKSIDGMAWYDDELMVNPET